MDKTTIGRRRVARRLALLTTLCAFVLLGAASVAPAALAAAADFVGGPATGDYPIYVPNDHTVCAVRFSAAAGSMFDKSGAAVTTAGATYYVKIRLSPQAAPSGSDNRGFTWNAATSSWVQERDDWAKFPVATTTDGGAIAGGTNWYYFSFGDATKSGTYYLMVSLQPTDAGTTGGTTQNSSLKPQVKIMDMSGALPGAQTGFWVHNAAATGFAGKRVEADAAGASAVWALSRSVGSAPPTAPVPGDGTAGADGDFVLGVPTGAAFDVKLQSTTWAGITGTLADVDIALGASDTTPPSAPGTLTVSPGDKSATLTWAAATDAAGVAGYSIYRWVDPPAGSGYTAQPVAVHDTAGAATLTWTDAGLTNGTTYHYLVRARDAATNVGPRSNAVTAVPGVLTAVTLKTSAGVVPWGGRAALTGTLSAGSGLAGKTVSVQASVAGGDWTTVGSPVTGAGGSFSTAVTPTEATSYRVAFAGDTTYGASTSESVVVTPMVRLAAVSAPASVTKNRAFAATGSLTPQMPAGSSTVKIRCYLKKGGAWKLRSTFSAKNSDKGAASVYRAAVKLVVAGRWKLVAYAPATAQYAATTAAARYVTVK